MILSVYSLVKIFVYMDVSIQEWCSKQLLYLMICLFLLASNTHSKCINWFIALIDLKYMSKQEFEKHISY